MGIVVSNCEALQSTAPCPKILWLSDRSLSMSRCSCCMRSVYLTLHSYGQGRSAVGGVTNSVCRASCLRENSSFCFLVQGFELVRLRFLWGCLPRLRLFLPSLGLKNAACASRCLYFLDIRVLGDGGGGLGSRAAVVLLWALLQLGGSCGRSPLIVISTSEPCFIEWTRWRHPTLFCASWSRPVQVKFCGTSMRRWPVFENVPGCLWISLDESILSMWPTHCKRLALIQAMMSNVREFLLASSCCVFLVMRAIIRLFAPFNLAQARGVSLHASDPYVNFEQTPVLYNRSLRLSGMDFEAQMFLIFPAVICAAAILASTSHSWSPSARIQEPRYLKIQTFSMSSPSQTGWHLSFCANLSSL